MYLKPNQAAVNRDDLFSVLGMDSRALFACRKIREDLDGKVLYEHNFYRASDDVRVDVGILSAILDKVDGQGPLNVVIVE